MLDDLGSFETQQHIVIIIILFYTKTSHFIYMKVLRRFADLVKFLFFLKNKCYNGLRLDDEVMA